MRRTIAFVIAVVCTLSTLAQSDTVTQRIFLIGDAGEIAANGHHPVIDWLKKNVDWNDTRNMAIFLGDNIYPLGMPMEHEPGYDEAKRIIDYEMSPFVGKKAKAFFIPGNHDWENGKLGGWQRIRNQEDYINGQEHKNISSPLTEGCPGPVVDDSSSKQVCIVFIDSQWFLYIHDKPGPTSSCGSRTVEEFETELREIIVTHPNQMVLLVTHHPLYSYGVHGGDYTWKDILFPFTALNKKLLIPAPPLGLIYVVTRGVFGNLQDVKHPLYQIMANSILAEMKGHPNTIIASGHDHSLQMIVESSKKDTVYQIVSGAGSNLSRVKTEKAKAGKLLFDDLHYGFSLIEVTKSGKVTTRFYNINSKDLADPTYSHYLRSIVAPPSVTLIAKDSIPVLPDSVLVMASEKLHESGFRNLFMGENYRAEWTTPVKVQVLNLGKELGGLNPIKQGGGKQTRSLRMKDSTGKEWNLRSVEKFPDAAIPPDLQQTFVKQLVNQGISASYPFAALSVDPLAKAAGIPSLRSKLIYIPDDPRLGRFRPVFKNTLALMEERRPVGVKSTDNTDDVVLALKKDNDNHIDQISVLKARLLDNFYMDFDRNESQWEWGKRDTGKGKIYYAIPKDHDQVFFVNQGIIPYTARSPWLVPEIQGFRSKAINIKTFNRPARNFDRFFLNELDKETWSNYVDTFLKNMTDDVIEKALLLQPGEIRHLHAANIIKKLKERRQYFKDEMMQYYDFLAKQVNVVGSNQRELFTIDKLPGDKVHLTVNKLSKKDVLETKMYDRIFDAKETKELMLYGLNDRDSFVVRGGYTSMKIRIIGGPGNDDFVYEGNVGRPVRVYDVTFDENHFLGDTSGFIKHVAADPRNNEYNRFYYKYAYFKPDVLIGFNIDDGLFLGAKGELLTQGFRKEPFSMQQIFRIGHALKTSAYFFNYDAIFTKALGNNDILVRGSLQAPIGVSNFFGLGNNTLFNKDVPSGVSYYRARYSIGSLSVLLHRQLQSWMRVNYGPTFQYFHVRQDVNANKLLGSGNLLGVDQSSLYDRKAYVGAEVGMDINSRINTGSPTNEFITTTGLPTRGVVLNAGVKQLFGVNSNKNNLTQLHFDLGVLASFETNATLVYGARIGIYSNIGSFEVPQAQYLSGTENLRGFRRNRFAGRTMLFENTEVRWKLADFSTYLFPGAFGIFAFNDVGRVWMDQEKSSRWHDGYGGGIWIAPIRRWVFTVSVAHSAEESLIPYASVGFRF